ncbi:MAG TPA: helix-turn-helix transcriptional regulator [Kofleriaceae bacterium]|jgi:AraC-like DNA-binding protein|nr:helix-turn-helix transcriptional regulator [Kofleriaceae bacterium]
MFQRGPVGHYATGENLMMWCTRPELCGLVFWDRPSFADLRELAHVYDHGEIGTGIAVPCDFVLDARRVTGVDPGMYEGFIGEVGGRLADIRRRLRRQAFVRPSGLPGAAVSAFYTLLETDPDLRIFTDLQPALDWVNDPDSAGLAAYLEELTAEVVSGSTLVDRLRAWLATQQDRPMITIEEAGRGLALSARSLQRRLREAGTSFRAELDGQRLITARRLLLETDLKIAAIAQKVGRSEPNFISWFRRLEGESPAAWRRQRRPGDVD